MAENAVTTFELPVSVEIKFDAQDLVDRMSPLDLLKLVKEIDALMSWEFTELLARYTRSVSDKCTDDDISGMTDSELEDSLVAEVVDEDAV